MSMTSLDTRINLLGRLREYILSDNEEWIAIKDRAERENGWFTQENIETAINNIANEFLDKSKLEEWVAKYNLNDNDKTVGVVMAGNIPLVGFHDFLSVFMSGNRQKVKLSSKDSILFSHIAQKMNEWDNDFSKYVSIEDMLKGCDAYIATGSNNSARYFEQYFSKYPNIIRKNRTSVAVLDGNESQEDILNLGKDIFSYFGLGCRNVTKLYLPKGYKMEILLSGLEHYKYIINHNKYKNNYDYHLAIYLLNKVNFYTNESLLFVENELPFSAVSVLHYEHYDDKADLVQSLEKDKQIQCVVDGETLTFGNTQKPSLTDYADAVDTMAFLSDL